MNNDREEWQYKHVRIVRLGRGADGDHYAVWNGPRIEAMGDSRSAAVRAFAHAVRYPAGREAAWMG